MPFSKNKKGGIWYAGVRVSSIKTTILIDSTLAKIKKAEYDTQELCFNQ